MAMAKIEENAFKTEDEATAMAKEAGFFPVTIEREAYDLGDHWHDFNAMIFLLDGDLTVTDCAGGETRTCGAGTIIHATKNVLHRERTNGYRAVIGLDRDPTALTMPIDKAPEELPVQ